MTSFSLNAEEFLTSGVSQGVYFGISSGVPLEIIPVGPFLIPPGVSTVIPSGRLPGIGIP